MLEVSPAWQQIYPGAALGMLAMAEVVNPPHHAQLDKARIALEDQLRTHYAGLDRNSIGSEPTMQAYRTYYKRFKKTYHVLLQLESVINGKPIPSVSALVEAMFMAEMKNRLLTAGHDLDSIHLPMHLDIARGDEDYTLLRGEDQICKAGDMILSDAQGVICSVIYGSDQRTIIKSSTRRVLYVVYVPPGIPHMDVDHHLNELESNVRLVSPHAIVESRSIITHANR